MNRKQRNMHLKLLQGDFHLPTENQQIVKVTNLRGNSLYDVVDKDGSEFVAVLQRRFLYVVWVKRDSFVIVDEIAKDDKVKFEIVQVLTPEYVKFLKKENVFPKEFENDTDNGYTHNCTDGTVAADSGSDEDDSDLVPNTNHRVFEQSTDEDSSDSD